MAKRLRANDLNRLITIQRKGITEDDAGYPIPDAKDWEDVVTTWAAREPLKGREFFAVASSQTEVSVRYKIRYRTGIEAGMRIVDLKDNRFYMIDVPPLDDVFDDRTETHLMVSEASNG